MVMNSQARAKELGCNNLICATAVHAAPARLKASSAQVDGCLSVVVQDCAHLHRIWKHKKSSGQAPSQIKRIS